MKKPRRCWVCKFALMTDEAMRRERAGLWQYGIQVLGLKPETVRPKTVWKKTWKARGR